MPTDTEFWQKAIADERERADKAERVLAISKEQYAGYLDRAEAAEAWSNELDRLLKETIGRTQAERESLQAEVERLHRVMLDQLHFSCTGEPHPNTDECDRCIWEIDDICQVTEVVTRD